MYDFANSAYILTVATAVLPVYFASVVVPKAGYHLGNTLLSASTLWGLAVSLAALLVFLVAPVLGAIADALSCKKRFLAAFCLTGSLCATLLATCGPGDALPALGLFILAQASFAGGNVFYDAFLPSLAPDSTRDALSSRGYAYGYVGGGLQFLLCLLLIAFHNQLGLSKDAAARVSLAFAGLWWAAFALPFLLFTPEARGQVKAAPSLVALAKDSIIRTMATTRTLVANRPLFLFLLAFFLYNDGVQTTIAMAAIYGKEELGLGETVLMTTLLLVQFVAIAGATLFARLARRVGTRAAIQVSLGAWVLIAAYASFIQSAAQYLVLGVLVGLVLAPPQALSRSLYASLIPANAPAQYFGFFSVITKFSAILGPFLFAVIRHTTGSSRAAVPAMALFFAAGMILLAKVEKPGQ